MMLVIIAMSTGDVVMHSAHWAKLDCHTIQRRIAMAAWSGADPSDDLR